MFSEKVKAKMEEQEANQKVTSTFRLLSLESDIDDIKKQLDLCVSYRENEAQLQNIHTAVERIEARIEKDLTEATRQLEVISTKISIQESEARAQREGQSALQIKVLWGTISLIFGLVASVLVGYITHFFH